MQETQCPQCGEWLGVPPEFADRPIRCGVCGRIIPPHERSGSAPSPPPPPPSPDRGGPRFPDGDGGSPRPSGPRFPDRYDDRDDPPRRKGGGLWWVWLLAVGGFGFCCCGGGIVFLLAAANAKWESYTAPKGAFTAEFPGTPVETTSAFKWNDDKEGTAYQYLAVQPIQGQAFAVHYADMPKSAKGVRPSDDLLLTLAVNHIKANTTNFTLQSEAPAKVGEYKGRDVEGTVTDPKLGMLQVSVRVVIVGDRVFMLYAAGKVKEKAKLTPQKDRFFNSFKPADPKEK